MKIYLEDQGQDFLTVSVDKNGVMSGYSIIFRNGNLSLIGIGMIDGKEYLTLDELNNGNRPKGKNNYIYCKKTESETHVPWEASIIKYRVIKIT